MVAVAYTFMSVTTIDWRIAPSSANCLDLILTQSIERPTVTEQRTDRLRSTLLSVTCREKAGHFVTSTDAKSPRGEVTASRRASDCTLKLEEIVHNLAYADRRLQVC